MDSDREIHINPSQSIHLDLMRSIAQQVGDTPYVLKGGAALIFTRALNRYSTDLDFDSTKKLNLKGRIAAAISEVNGIELKSLKLVKDTDTVQRYKIHYLDQETGNDRLLKVETSFRESPQLEAVETISGIKTYRLEQQVDQKLSAAQHRTAARDLYDLDFLVNHYGSQLRDDQIEAIHQFASEPDHLVDRYSSSFETDEVLSLFNKGEDVVLSLHLGAERLLKERQEEIANTTQNKVQDSQSLYNEFSSKVDQPGLIGAGLVAQNALKAGYAKSDVESMLLKHDPSIRGIVAEQGQEKGVRAAAIVVRGARMKSLTTESLDLEQGTQAPSPDQGQSL
ncbi:nucleotidyl transferase AbiEii/AbiGii toxin family protein [Acaryochloris sp. CCMEE 5410]|uniref:nucleotidyl transferase AbiEii/AbiGii toxin family protein n=1 Tax=Acaryochloris sp. CCMEE 5410 TaxID=310037 RepID=UPI00024837C6|nr:nucleotidyl transferase AbiEii/AbiGii toxin family protein [Acaryochloris sp. CCMEE 5410]KAI9129605.1 nucleotidyl transferase AbiEii/AbiGii toxin family protein [Acaryochloris sp. CCMEE 5410]